MDALQTAYEVTRLKGLMVGTFGAETGTELIDLAADFAERSQLAPNRALEIAYQVGEEFGSEVDGVFDEMHAWVERTAEDHHPHNTQLYLRALIWVIMKRRASG